MSTWETTNKHQQYIFLPMYKHPSGNTWLCSECKSPNILEALWIHANTGAIDGTAQDGLWCIDCEAEVDIYIPPKSDEGGE